MPKPDQNAPTRASADSIRTGAKIQYAHPADQVCCLFANRGCKSLLSPEPDRGSMRQDGWQQNAGRYRKASG